MTVLTHNQAFQRVDELRKKLDEWTGDYYAKDTPMVEDAVYDKVYQELVELEKRLPGLVTSGLTTQRIGGEVKSDLSKVERPVPMLSMGNVFSKDELRELDDRITKLVEHPMAYNAELKTDGLSLSLKYTAGKPTRASTRGNGCVGEDMTTNAKFIKDIPQTLPEPLTTEVHGERYMEREAFAELNAERDGEGERVFTNPRNAVTGSLRQSDARITRKRNLSTFIYIWVNPPRSVASQCQAIDKMDRLGFHTDQTGHRLESTGEALKSTDEHTAKYNDLSYGTDGIISKVDDLSL